jgi:hypothetical protein
MKTVISLASILAYTFSSSAQITTTLKHRPDGMDEVRIRNDSASTLVASVVAGKRVAQSPASPRELLRNAIRNTETAASYMPFVLYSDPLIEPVSRPLPASEERVMMTMSMQNVFNGGVRVWSLEEPILAAGIFADGSTTGDAALLSRLMLRRSSMLLSVEMALEALSDAGRRSVPRYQLIMQFKKMTDSLHRWYLTPEQQIGLRVYQPILGKLTNMPGKHDGSPDPLAIFIAEETAALRKQRVTLSESQPSLADEVLVGR